MTKKFLSVVLAVLFSSYCYSQQRVDENTYKSKSGMIFRVGDEVTLGYGSNFNKDFKYVVSGLDLTGIGAPWHSKKFTIKRIREYGNNKRGNTSYLIIGAGLMNFWIDIEGAIEFDEIVIPDEFKTKKTSQPQTIVSVADELTKLKKLLDDGVLTKEEFDAQKKKLLEKGNN